MEWIENENAHPEQQHVARFPIIRRIDDLTLYEVQDEINVGELVRKKLDEDLISSYFADLIQVFEASVDTKNIEFINLYQSRQLSNFLLTDHLAMNHFELLREGPQ